MIPGGGQPNMQQLLQQAQKMQQDLAQAQEELARTEVEGQAGGGLVKATVTGSGELRGLVIDPKAVDPEDTETLADLVVAAVQAANENAQSSSSRSWARWPRAWAAAGHAGPALLSPAAHQLPYVPRTATTVRTEGPRKAAVRCTKAWSRTSSTNWAGCPASVPRARSGSPSTSCRPSRPTYAASRTR